MSRRLHVVDGGRGRPRPLMPPTSRAPRRRRDEAGRSTVRPSRPNGQTYRLFSKLRPPPQTLIRAKLPYFSWGGLNLNTPLGASCLSSTLDLTLAHPGQRPARAAKHHRHDPRRGPMPRVNKRAQLAETATALGQAKLSFGGCLSIERPSRPTAPKTTATSTPATAVAERCAEVDEVPLMHCPQCRFRTASAIPCAALYTGGP